MKTSAGLAILGILSYLAGAGIFLVTEGSRPAASRRSEPAPSLVERSQPVELVPCARCAPAEAAAITSAAALERCARERSAAEDGTRPAMAALILDLRCQGERLPFELFVEVSGAWGSRYWRWRPDQRRLAIPAGRARLSFTLFGDMEGEVTRDLGPLFGEVERAVEVPGLRGVYGRVRGLADDCRARILIAPQGLAPSASWVLPADEEDEPDSQSAPTFAFELHGHGRYRIGISYDNHCAEPLGSVDYRGDPVFVELDAPPQPGASLLAFEAFDARGDPVEDGLKLTLLFGDRQLETRRRGGALRLLCSRPEDLTGLQLRGRSRFGQAQAEASLESRATLRFKDTARLKVELRDLPRRLARRRLELVWTPKGSERAWEEEVHGGRAVFPALPLGRGTLALRASYDEVLARRVLDLQAGDRSETFDTLPPLADLRVEILGTRGGDLYLRGDGLSRRKSCELWDRVLFRDLPHGRYQLSDGDKNYTVTVPGPPVVVKREPIRSLVVRISDPLGAYRRAGLRDGDRILAIDGQAVSSDNDLLWSCHRVRLRRGGQELELRIDARRLRDREALLGGALEPVGD